VDDLEQQDEVEEKLLVPFCSAVFDFFFFFDSVNRRTMKQATKIDAPSPL